MEHVSQAAGGAPRRRSHPRNVELGPPPPPRKPRGGPRLLLPALGRPRLPRQACRLSTASAFFRHLARMTGASGASKATTCAGHGRAQHAKGPPRERQTASWEESSHSKRGEVTAELAYQTSRLPRKCRVPGLPAASWVPSSVTAPLNDQLPRAALSSRPQTLSLEPKRTDFSLNLALNRYDAKARLQLRGGARGACPLPP